MLSYGEVAARMPRLAAEPGEYEPQQVHVSVLGNGSAMIMWVTSKATPTTTVTC